MGVTCRAKSSEPQLGEPPRPSQEKRVHQPPGHGQHQVLPFTDSTYYDFLLSQMRQSKFLKESVQSHKLLLQHPGAAVLREE